MKNNFQVEDKVKEELEILKEGVDSLNKKLEEKDKIICDLLNMVALVKKTENSKEVDEVIKQAQDKLMMGKRCASGEKGDEPGNKEDGLSSSGPIRKMGRHINGRQIINDSNVQSLTGVDVSSISRPFDSPVEALEINLDEMEAPDSHHGVSAKNTSGQRPSSIPAFQLPSDQQEQMLSHLQSEANVSTSVISEPYSALPTKSNLIIPKQAIYEWMSNLVEFANSNLPIQFYSISATSQKVQFRAYGLQPDMGQKDKDLFKASFGCMIKYYLKSRKSGCSISIAAVEGPRHHRDELCTSRPWAFNCFSIHFSQKSYCEQDDYVFPRCNLCQQWGHWCQNCTHHAQAKCCHCSNTDHSSGCVPDPLKRRCANCQGPQSD
ncbi:hypothetical protein ACOME3_000406 [Neoechinorhynchus agilis]